MNEFWRLIVIADVDHWYIFNEMTCAMVMEDGYPSVYVRDEAMSKGEIAVEPVECPRQYQLPCLKTMVKRCGLRNNACGSESSDLSCEREAEKLPSLFFGMCPATFSKWEEFAIMDTRISQSGRYVLQ